MNRISLFFGIFLAIFCLFGIEGVRNRAYFDYSLIGRTCSDPLIIRVQFFGVCMNNNISSDGKSHIYAETTNGYIKYAFPGFNCTGTPTQFPAGNIKTTCKAGDFAWRDINDQVVPNLTRNTSIMVYYTKPSCEGEIFRAETGFPKDGAGPENVRCTAGTPGACNEYEEVKDVGIKYSGRIFCGETFTWPEAPTDLPTTLIQTTNPTTVTGSSNSSPTGTSTQRSSAPMITIGFSSIVLVFLFL